jgi:hypothetical protein
MSKTTQICATVPVELSNDITDMANNEDRTFSQMVAILLKKAIKEKNRKKISNVKVKKESYSSSNSRD